MRHYSSLSNALQWTKMHRNTKILETIFSNSVVALTFSVWSSVGRFRKEPFHCSQVFSLQPIIQSTSRSLKGHMLRTPITSIQAQDFAPCVQTSWCYYYVTLSTHCALHLNLMKLSLPSLRLVFRWCCHRSPRRHFVNRVAKWMIASIAFNRQQCLLSSALSQTGSFDTKDLKWQLLKLAS